MKRVIVYLTVLLAVFVGFTACSDDVEVETNDCACCDLCTGTEDCTCGCGLCIYDTSSDTSGDGSSDTGSDDVIGGGSTGGTTGGSGSGSGTTTEEGTGSDTSDPSDDGDDQTPTVTDDYTVDEETGAYSIYTADGLAAWGQAVTTTGASIDATLMANIDWNDLTVEYSWVPVGNATRYEGIFDGNGYAISNLTISTGVRSTGFFGDLGNNAVVKNLGLVNVTVTADNGNPVGGIAGELMNASVINCYVDGGTISGTSYAGGIAGLVDGSSTLEGSWSSATVTTSGDDAGGIAGINGGTIVACYTASSVTNSGSGCVGGVIGYNYGTAVACYSIGDVTGSADASVGGVIGGDDGTVYMLFYRATITVGSEITYEPIGVFGSNGNSELPRAAYAQAWTEETLGYLNNALSTYSYDYSFTTSSGVFPYVLV